jgi:hypothetical protein
MKKLFFHLLDISFLNSYLLLTFYGWKLTYWDFRLAMVRDIIQEDEASLTADHPTWQTSCFYQSTNKTWFSAQRTLALRKCYCGEIWQMLTAYINLYCPKAYHRSDNSVCIIE